MIDKDMLDRTVAFHGHLCPGLLIGLRSAIIALAHFGTGRASDEELIAIVENRACGVDALQVVLGTTAGKGNLFFKNHGKQVVTVGSRLTGKAVRISLRRQEELSRAEKTERLMTASDGELFDVVEVEMDFPSKAKVFRSVACDDCGEGTMETALRLLEGRKLCEPCFEMAMTSKDFFPPKG
ncbi:MAG: FmdE family protein [Actinobacteria bacterium]|nr:FmdE family protein [Actinomycetota bacterium]